MAKIVAQRKAGRVAAGGVVILSRPGHPRNAIGPFVGSVTIVAMSNTDTSPALGGCILAHQPRR